MQIFLLLLTTISLLSSALIVDHNQFVGILTFILSVVAFLGFILETIEEYNFAKNYPNLYKNRQR